MRDRLIFAIMYQAAVVCVCARHDISLEIGHEPGMFLLESAGALNRWNLGQPYQDRVQCFIESKGMPLIDVQCAAFQLCPSL